MHDVLVVSRIASALRWVSAQHLGEAAACATATWVIEGDQPFPWRRLIGCTLFSVRQHDQAQHLIHRAQHSPSRLATAQVAALRVGAAVDVSDNFAFDVWLLQRGPTSRIWRAPATQNRFPPFLRSSLLAPRRVSQTVKTYAAASLSSEIIFPRREVKPNTRRVPTLLAEDIDRYLSQRYDTRIAKPVLAYQHDLDMSFPGASCATRGEAQRVCTSHALQSAMRMHAHQDRPPQREASRRACAHLPLNMGMGEDGIHRNIALRLV